MKDLSDIEIEKLFEDEDQDVDLDIDVEPCPISDLDDTTGYPGYVEFFLDKIETDPIAYKPYKPECSPTAAIVVRVPLDEKYVLSYDTEGKECVFVTLGGLQAILAQFADAVQSMDTARKNGKKF